jgi:hypothetical protein
MAASTFNAVVQIRGINPFILVDAARAEALNQLLFDFANRSRV